jgi:hypothetical protein
MRELYLSHLTEMTPYSSLFRKECDRYNSRIPSGDSSESRRLLAPLRGLKRLVFTSIPWADAHGYLLPSLRDSGKGATLKSLSESVIHFLAYASGYYKMANCLFILKRPHDQPISNRARMWTSGERSLEWVLSLLRFPISLSSLQPG